MIDVADGLKEQVAPLLSSFIPQLLQVLRDHNRQQQTKLHAINSLASVTCYASQSFCQFYLGESLSLLKDAANLSLQDAEHQDDPDTLEFLTELRAALIEAYSQIAIGVCDSRSQN